MSIPLPYQSVFEHPDSACCFQSAKYLPWAVFINLTRIIPRTPVHLIFDCQDWFARGIQAKLKPVSVEYHECTIIADHVHTYRT